MGDSRRSTTAATGARCRCQAVSTAPRRRSAAGSRARPARAPGTTGPTRTAGSSPPWTSRYTVIFDTRMIVGHLGHRQEAHVLELACHATPAPTTPGDRSPTGGLRLALLATLGVGVTRVKALRSSCRGDSRDGRPPRPDMPRPSGGNRTERSRVTRSRTPPATRTATAASRSETVRPWFSEKVSRTGPSRDPLNSTHAALIGQQEDGGRPASPPPQAKGCEQQPHEEDEQDDRHDPGGGGLAAARLSRTRGRGRAAGRPRAGSP